MSSAKLYIAGMGMITPLGPNVATTVAAVNAGISAYNHSEYQTPEGEQVTMAKVPYKVFENFSAEIDEGDRFNVRHDRLIKMAIIALREACAERKVVQPVPLLLALSERQLDSDGLSPIIPNLVHNLASWISPTLSRRISTGRAAGLEAVSFAFDYLMNQQHEYFLIGGTDSYQDDEIIDPLVAEDRLLSIGASDAFAPGEAASFLLLTPHIELAQVREGHAIALNIPGIAEEEGHLYSDKPYRGDGLDRAFKSALRHQPTQTIQRIYSSINGENHWAKEYGVAYLRNKAAFVDSVKLEHPADCYGDLGAATATTLIALAAEHLFKNKKQRQALVYSSSDFGVRGAIVIEKIRLDNGTEFKI